MSDEVRAALEGMRDEWRKSLEEYIAEWRESDHPAAVRGCLFAAALLREHPADGGFSTSNGACPFCGEGDFDLAGLKLHLTLTGCVEFEELEAI